MNKIMKSISMMLCSAIIVFGTINISTVEANAWSWKKSSKHPYRNTTVSKQYVGETDLEYLARVADDATKKMVKNNKSITKSSLKHVISSIFKGGNSKGALKTYLKKQTNNAKQVNNVFKEMNRVLDKNSSDFDIRW